MDYINFISTRGLPPYVCPIEDNKPKLYLGIALLLLSYIMSYISDRQKKNIKLKYIKRDIFINFSPKSDKNML